MKTEQQIIDELHIKFAEQLDIEIGSVYYSLLLSQVELAFQHGKNFNIKKTTNTISYHYGNKEQTQTD